MKLFVTPQFKKDYDKIPQAAKVKTKRILSLLKKNLRHPSIRVKKLKVKEDVWEGRIDLFYRFTFQIEKDKIILRRVGTHDILKIG